MKKLRNLLIAAAVALIGVGSAHNSPVYAASPVSICSQEEWDVLKLVNEERAKENLAPLGMFESIQKAADVRAKELFSLFSHSRPNGDSCFSVLYEKKIPYNTAGENIAAGQRNAASVVSSWMNSPGHRANILSPYFSHIGIGYDVKKDDLFGTYWVQLFVGECTPSSISIKGSGAVSSYKRGTSISEMNKVLISKCPHGTTYIPVTEDMCSGYKKNTAGLQTVKVKYGGSTASFQVNIKGSSIKGSSIKSAKVTGIKNKSYTGKKQTQKLKVVYKGKTLVKNRDYTVTYKNNKKPGKAKVIIKGKGKYYGTITKTFKIKKK